MAAYRRVDDLLNSHLWAARISSGSNVRLQVWDVASDTRVTSNAHRKLVDKECTTCSPPTDIFSSVLSQETGWQDCLRNDLFCVRWKTLTQSINTDSLGSHQKKIQPHTNFASLTLGVQE